MIRQYLLAKTLLLMLDLFGINPKQKRAHERAYVTFVGPATTGTWSSSGPNYSFTWSATL